MKIKNFSAFLAAAVIFLFFIPLTSSAQSPESEDLFHLPGTIEGTGTRFEITDSEYLNITLDSSEEITAKIESMPEMVIINVNASEKFSFANLKISGLSSNTIYHKYEDDYHNHTPFVSDENGVFSFEQDLSRDHIIFIQPRESTKFIKDDSTGGNCKDIGSWSSSSKTCTLNQNVSGTIQIDNGGITLNGDGHSVVGNGNTGTGIYFPGRSGITIKNVTTTNFYIGIMAVSVSNSAIISSTFKNNRVGIEFQASSNNVISNNIITENIDTGFYLLTSAHNIISGNVIGPENSFGIFNAWPARPEFSTGNVYENNEISGNNYKGIYIYRGVDEILRDNNVNDNLDEGINITQCLHAALSGNIISGNKTRNLYVSELNMDSHDIDASNTVEGKSVYFVKNAVNETYDGISDMGIFYCVNCDNVAVKNLSLSKNNAQILFYNTNNSLIENITSPDENIETIIFHSNNNAVKKSTLGSIRIAWNSDYNQICNNNFMDNAAPVKDISGTGNLFNLNPPTGGNYWKINEPNCKNIDNDDFCDSAYGKDKYPWVKAFNFNKPSCCSSVMFLPGHQGSRLYRKDSDGGEDQLWEPTNRNEDVEQLYLDSSGESVDPEIYTREIVDEIYGVGDNIYKSFIESMDQAVNDGIISEWKPIPYDWRLPLEKIAEEGVKLEDGGHMDIIEEIKKMAAESKTGKVTLVGHSNGGLLAKALINKLKDSGGEKLVDKLIMVGTPQLGTPKAAAGLLHGDEINLLYGLILDKKTARGFAENMISAYNLLPSSEYFNIVQSPVVEFDEDVSEIYDFRSLYDENIDNWNEFKKFLLGDDGARTDPDFGDTDSPNILREALLERAEETHDNLDDWQAPEGLEIIQIAGWGLDTIRGIKYDDCDIPFCPDKLSNLDRELILTEDGDKTVVVPSAVELSEGAERYYLNLYDYNYFLNFNVPRDHADILEIKPLQNFIKNIIQNNRTLADHISTEKPEVKDEDKRLRFRLHSPVAIDIYDQDENHTGLVQNDDSDLRFYEEKIPNSYYMEFGETKYAGTGDYPVDIKLTGEDLGTFSFEIDQVAGDQVIETTEFSNIPVMENMKAYISIDDSVGEMAIDIDDDGQTDITFGAGEEIKKEDLLEILEKIIYALDVDATVKDRLVNKIGNAQKQMEKGHIIAVNAMLENVKQQIETFSREQTPEKFRIPENEAEKLIGIIERIQAI